MLNIESLSRECALRLVVVATLSVALCCAPRASSAARTHGGFYTEEKTSNVLRNVAKFSWARKQRDVATSNAAIWLKKSDEELWNLVPGQALPRTIDVTWDYNHPEKPRIGCLVCGEKIFTYGNYPYNPDFWKAPWKLKCPSCGTVFPTNDFGKYYRSGIDEHGLFNPAKADRSLLFNAKHPDPKDPLHMFGVDDGYGYVDANGRAHKFIGYYTWKLWNQICNGVSALADAYIYTGNKAYARKAAILLDRIADVYPDMDWKPYADRGWYHSDGGTHLGKIGGRIWETNILSNFARDYDKILGGTNDNPELSTFLKKKGARFKLPRPKGTRDLFVENVDTGILRCGAAGVKTGQIAGNDGMKQDAIVACAVALDTMPESKEWIDWAFDANGGELPTIIIGGFDRDGTGEEGAPNYSLLWVDKLLAIGERLDGYPRGGHNLFAEFPQLRQSFTAGWRMLVLGMTTPNIGDSGATGLIDKMQCKPQFIAKGFKFLRDPEIARAAYEANGNSAKDLLLDVFANDPLALNRELEAVAKGASTKNELRVGTSGSINMAGFGLAKLEFGRAKTGSAIWCYYGRNGGHGHHDNLNFSIYGFGVDLAPDLGYPEFATPAWPNRIGWTANTLSHNTVVVDSRPQAEVWDGQPRFFESMEGFGAFEIASNRVYPKTEEYARTMMLVEAPGSDVKIQPHRTQRRRGRIQAAQPKPAAAGEEQNAYALDIFRIRGGEDHVFSFHGPPGKVLAEGLKLEAQTSGTYAGEQVAFADHGETIPLGYPYLYDVERDRHPSSNFVLDWATEPGYRGVTGRDNIHLRYHSLSPCDDIALADGDPPQNKPFNPRRIRYALLHRSTSQPRSNESSAPLASTFVSLLEPYRAQPFIKSATRLLTDPADDQNVAVCVELNDGTVDYLLSTPSKQPVRVPDPDITFCARSGFLRTHQGKVLDAKMICGSRLDFGKVHLSGRPAIEGTVASMEKDLKKPASVIVKGDLPTTTSLAGQQIIFANDGKRNACYTIESVEPAGDASENLHKITCIPGSFVRQFRERHDYSKGLVYEFDEGTTFTIPHSVSLK